MAEVKEQVVPEIHEHISRLGGAYRSWYVGIAADPQARLFRDHGVDERSSAWIFRECESVEVARQVEDLFVRVLGADGGPSGGDATARWVYAYRKTLGTRP